MKKCYIVGAGEFFGSIHPCEEDLVIAADGGLVYLEKMGIVPDVVVGDFDSLEERQDFDTERVCCAENNFCSNESRFFITKRGKNIEVVKHPIMKDETDMYLAYEIGSSRGYKEFELYGGVGGREDHTFANYCLLLRAKNDKNDIALIGNGVRFFVIKNEKKRVFGNPEATVSAFAFGGIAEGVDIRGLKYEAKNVTLYPDRPLGVSNSFLSSGEGEISVERGALLVCVFEK